MCGIAGIISKNNSFLIKDKIIAMSQSIKHRGPDGEGFCFFDNDNTVAAFSAETPSENKLSPKFNYNPTVCVNDVAFNYTLAFAHRRLSIIDLSEAGHQPMCDSTCNYWITFNGEVYNYIELRAELQLNGHQFLTQTDTEVVIAAYKQWGVNCLQRFNGMFAFALFDKKNNIIFCARDRVGVKPFYYSNNNLLFAFASEYKAFIKSGILKFEINESQQFNYLVNANLETQNESLFNGIVELKPSHYLIYDLTTHQLNLTQYYSISNNTISFKTDNELISIIEEKVVNAIKLRLRSDVEVGSCLSGGLDSSIIAGVIKHLQPTKHLKLFTAVFPAERFDESNHAKLVANTIHAKWFNVSPTAADFFNDIEQLNYYQDLPIWSTSTYSQHRVMKLAADNNIKVLLDGQGADELFAGYAHHYYAYWKQNLGLHTFLQIKSAQQSLYKPYQLFFKQQLKEHLKITTQYKKYFNENLSTQITTTQHQPFFNNLNDELKRDYFGKLKSFLKCEDRCSMAFGIESRVPFADDVNLVDFIFSVEGNKKIQNGVSKYLLREATKQFIPQLIYARKDKVGFETPVEKWFLPNKKMVLTEIKEQLNFVNYNYIHSNFDKILKQKPTFILRLYSFAIWKKVFSAI